MHASCLLLVALTVSTSCAAQVPRTEASCSFTAESRLDFRAQSSRDRLIVRISDGPCSGATLALEIKSRDGKVLYRFRSSLRNLVLEDPFEGPYAEQALNFAKSMLATGMTPPADRLPLDEIRKGPASDMYTLAVSQAAYRAHMRSQRYVFSHATYYEGGVTIVFDPKTARAKVLYSWGA